MVFSTSLNYQFTLRNILEERSLKLYVAEYFICSDVDSRLVVVRVGREQKCLHLVLEHPVFKTSRKTPSYCKHFHSKYPSNLQLSVS
jgi:hypothetical protein